MTLQLISLIVRTFLSTKSEPATFLECGHVDIGTVNCDIIVREESESMPQRQLDFLHRADRRWKRLHFVWNEGMLCGCCGGCRFLDNVVQRPNGKIHSISEFSRYFTHVQSTENEKDSSIPCNENIGYIHSFCNLSSLEQLHKVLLSHYHLKVDISIDTNLMLQSTTNVVLTNDVEVEALSHGSDSSFVSARESLSSLNDIDQFQSIHNSPQVTDKHTKLRKKVSEYGLGNSSPRVKPKPQQSSIHAQSALYRNILDSYELKLQRVKVFSSVCTPSSVHRQDKVALPVLTSMKYTTCDFGTSTHPSFQKEHSHKFGHSYLLTLPTILHRNTGCIPVLISSNSTHDMDMATIGKMIPSQYNSPLWQREWKQQKPPSFSVSVDVAGGFGVLLSPLLISFAEK